MPAPPSPSDPLQIPSPSPFRPTCEPRSPPSTAPELHKPSRRPRVAQSAPPDRTVGSAATRMDAHGAWRMRSWIQCGQTRGFEGFLVHPRWRSCFESKVLFCECPGPSGPRGPVWRSARRSRSPSANDLGGRHGWHCLTLTCSFVFLACASSLGERMATNATKK